MARAVRGLSGSCDTDLAIWRRRSPSGSARRPHRHRSSPMIRPGSTVRAAVRLWRTTIAVALAGGLLARPGVIPANRDGAARGSANGAVPNQVATQDIVLVLGGE